jgi:Cu(I)/Ag(I) efflux system membrane fusion protein
MDPNFRRDKPGKSPMGMDLIPVYPLSDKVDESLVSLTPGVQNNLGVRTTVVKRQQLPTTIRTMGQVHYDEEQRVHIHPRVEGWVDRLYVKAAGDPVLKGEPLYALYSPELVNAQEDLLLALKRKDFGLIQAAENRLRALQIDESHIARLKHDKKVRQTLTFFVPQTGVVDNLNIREGFFVKPGTTMMAVASLDDIWVEAQVYERQSPLIAVGQEAIMTLDYLPGRRWQGRVDYVYPSLNADTRTLRVRLRFKNPQGDLKPGMFAQISIYPDAREKALVVPSEAVIRTGKMDRVVKALGQGRFQSVEVRLGRWGDDQVEVLRGLEEGEQIVTSAQFLLDSESNKRGGLQRLNRVEDLISAPHQHHSMNHGEHQHD